MIFWVSIPGAADLVPPQVARPPLLLIWAERVGNNFGSTYFFWHNPFVFFGPTILVWHDLVPAQPPGLPSSYELREGGIISSLSWHNYFLLHYHFFSTAWHNQVLAQLPQSSCLYHKRGGISSIWHNSLHLICLEDAIYLQNLQLITLANLDPLSWNLETQDLILCHCIDKTPHTNIINSLINPCYSSFPDI